MITNQLLYQLSYTGMGLFSNEDRRKKEVAEEVGFEPTDGCPSPVFKTGALNRSATLPPGAHGRT